MDANRDSGGRVSRNRERPSYAPYQKDRKSFRQSYLCKNCKRPGHFARECPNDSVCNNCGQPGLFVACAKGVTMGRIPLCTKCFGHISKASVYGYLFGWK